jgi:hypothetical protein
MKKSNSKSFLVDDSDFRASGWCGNRPKCVKVALKPEGVAVRDSKDPSKATLFFDHGEWDAFVKGVKAGEFDRRV